MEENTQENAENVGSAGKIDEKIVEEPRRILEKNDSTETEESIPLDQTKEPEEPEDLEDSAEVLEDQENQEDFNSARSRSDSECTDSRTGSEGQDDDDDASVVLEREEGDGQESTPNRKVDDDEDKRNPQYIPKKGTFYEHDDRTAADEGEEEVKEQPEDDKSEQDAGKKKVWSEKEANKWSHDRFNDHEQAPKSRQELIAIYGYDIRNEEGPPRARRRRRYGRGPNKYTRNWEDEDAYSKPTNVSVKPVQRKPRTRPGQEEFPPLNPEEEVDQPRSDSKSSDRTESDEIGRNSGSQDGKENREIKGQIDETDRKDDELQQRRDTKNYAHQNARKEYRGGRNAQKRNDEQMRASVANNVRGITKTRGYFKNGGRGGVDQMRVRNQRNQKPNSGDEYSDYILSQNFTNKSMGHHQQNVQKLEKDMANMTMQQTGNEAPTTKTPKNSSYTGSTTTRGGKFGNPGGNRQTSVPPRLQQEQRGSKRYSSLRQRSLPETAGPNFGPQPSYFPTEYPQQPTTQPQSQAGLLPHPPPPTITSTTTPQLITVAPSQPLNPIAANGAPPPLMQGPPPQFAQPYAQPPPTFMQPAVAPPGVAPFIAQQAPPPQIINYAQPQFTGQFGQFQHQHQHQHQHQQFNPVNPGPPQPGELYQPQGGITYYSTQNQQVVPRAPPKRVKSAIPIVPPPEHKEPRGRGRLHQAEQESPGGGAPEHTPPADHYEQNCEFTADAPVATMQ